MKNRILPVLALIAFTLTLASCYSSRRSKTGCPMNVGKVAPAAPATKAA